MSVFNVQSEYDEKEMEQVRQRALREHLDMKPSKGELKMAKSGKAGGSSGILPEMVLQVFAHTVWEERHVPQEWADATLIPIPKKGNLRDCNNWRGIALLDVVGKVVARERLQWLAEQVLPKSQCGFRKARSCLDMVFTVRMLMEKTILYRTPSQGVPPLCGFQEGV